MHPQDFYDKQKNQAVVKHLMKSLSLSTLKERPGYKEMEEILLSPYVEYDVVISVPSTF